MADLNDFSASPSATPVPTTTAAQALARPPTARRSGLGSAALDKPTGASQVRGSNDGGVVSSRNSAVPANRRTPRQRSARPPGHPSAKVSMPVARGCQHAVQPPEHGRDPGVPRLTSRAKSPLASIRRQQTLCWVSVRHERISTGQIPNVVAALHVGRNGAGGPTTSSGPLRPTLERRPCSRRSHWMSLRPTCQPSLRRSQASSR